MSGFTRPARGPRRRLADALRARVAGDDLERRTADIWGKPGPRRFSADDPIWWVHSDSAMFVGGIRALLLQSLHPLAMAGVAGHSGYRGDPWGRLHRTSDFIAKTTFATIPDADAAIERVREVHRRVRGRAPDGRDYSASDPHLLRWVHVAEIDSFLSAYQAYNRRSLTAAERDTYVAQSAVAARALGATQVPTTERELRDCLAAYRPELQSTAAARDAARFLIFEPPLPLSARPGYAMLTAGALHLLPTWALRMLDLGRVGTAARLAGRPAGWAGAAVVRWALTEPSVAAQRRSRPADPAAT